MAVVMDADEATRMREDQEGDEVMETGTLSYVAEEDTIV